MLRFDASSFAIAGAIATAGPILIHLLNRRRFKTVNWAAMDFLREAIERNRKILHFRDILLLALRMLVVVLFGLVLARPFYKGTATGALWQAGLLGFCLLLTVGCTIVWATGRERRGNLRSIGMLSVALGLAFPVLFFLRQSSAENETIASVRTPVHAVMVIDNSRSMGVESLGGTLLERAKSKVVEFIDSLPPESRLTVIPLAGSEDPFTLDAYRNKEDARRAIERVKLVDTETNIRGGFEQALQACQQTNDLPSKRVVILTDAQSNVWRAVPATGLIKQLSGLQVVVVTTNSSRNVWVSGFQIEDGLTSSEVPCRFLARIHASGISQSTEASPEEMFEVQAKLLIDGVEVASQPVELTANQEREIEFTHQFELPVDPLKPGSAVATVVVQSELQSTDQLASDNRQQIVVPIVASLPVIFVDQYGDDENLEQSKIGETYALRHLMSPRASTDKSQRRMIHVEHVRPDQLTEKLLETARLIIVAGLEHPDESAVSLLRDFVRQGGPLVILAGGQFDAAKWSELAWLSGRGILPAPLEPKAIGYTPEEDLQQLRPFYAAFPSMQHDFFLIEGEDPQSLASLFESTPFFKAVQVDLSPAVLGELLMTETKRLTEEKRFLEQYTSRTVERHESAKNQSHSDEDERTFREIEPVWWSWRSPISLIDRSLEPEQLARQSQPRVLATFSVNQAPFVVERRIGAGRVIFFASGVTSNWNMMRNSGAMYLFHRAFCQLMEGTLPKRNFVAGQKMTFPVERLADVRYSVTRPSGLKEPLNIDAIGATASGVTLRRAVVAGTYFISSEQFDTSSPGSSSTTLDEIPIAVNGVESESDLTTLSVTELQTKLGHDDVRVLGMDESIRMDGGTRRAHDLWKVFAWSVLVSLLLEQLILAWPMLKKSKS